MLAGIASWAIVAGAGAPLLLASTCSAGGACSAIMIFSFWLRRRCGSSAGAGGPVSTKCQVGVRALNSNVAVAACKSGLGLSASVTTFTRPGTYLNVTLCSCIAIDQRAWR